MLFKNWFSVLAVRPTRMVSQLGKVCLVTKFPDIHTNNDTKKRFGSSLFPETVLIVLKLLPYRKENVQWLTGSHDQGCS